MQFDAVSEETDRRNELPGLAELRRGEHIVPGFVLDACGLGSCALPLVTARGKLRPPGSLQRWRVHTLRTCASRAWPPSPTS